LNNDGNGASLVQKFVGQPKKGLLYVNFQDNTLERIALKRHFSAMPWVTFRSKPNMPVEEYLSELSEHHFVLSPEGNGLDCYRNYEAMYLGVIPILQRSVFSENMLAANLPVAVVDNYYGIHEGLLADAVPTLEKEIFSKSDYRMLKASFWRQTLSQQRG
jgi:hypothetical protein